MLTTPNRCDALRSVVVVRAWDLMLTVGKRINRCDAER